MAKAVEIPALPRAEKISRRSCLTDGCRHLYVLPTAAPPERVPSTPCPRNPPPRPTTRSPRPRAPAASDRAMSVPRVDTVTVLRALARELGELAATHAELAALLQVILAKLEKLGLRADHLARLVEELADANTAALSANRVSRLMSGTIDDAVLEQAAAKGVEQIELLRLPGGKFVIRIEQAAPFPLPPRLGEFLRLLALEGIPEVPAERLVAWKSGTDLSIGMHKAFGCKFTPHNLSQIASRLRQQFRVRRQNPFLIQTSGASYRLALVRPCWRSNA